MLLDQIEIAFDRKDYKTAAGLLKAFLEQSPHDPWGQVYRARLYEISGRFDKAKAVYQQLLRTVGSPKIIAVVRSSLQQIHDREQAQRQQAIEQAKSDLRNAESGVLILEAIPPEERSQAAVAIAEIFGTDAYTARVQIPNRGWRLSRVGAIGELEFYGQQLRSANIPVFWARESDLHQLPVFEVQYFSDYNPQATLVCQNEQGHLGSMTFDWSEVSQRVEGMLPIFEQVVDTTMRQGIQRQRKEQTQDYRRICDLHLPKRHCILRICDWNYCFDQGIKLPAIDTNTIDLDQAINRLHWNSLMTFLRLQLPKKNTWSEFTSFAETAIDYPLFLNRIPNKISFYGQDSSLWNSAFQLYSSLAFIRN
jgi:hypothetical protein